MLATAVVVSLGGLLVSSGTASADPLDGPIFWKTCGDLSWPRDSGVVNIRISPAGTIAWNAFDYTDNFGVWISVVMVGKRQVDRKVTDYNPHGSMPKSKLPSGQLFRVSIDHTNTSGKKSFSDPGAGCIIP